MRSTKTRGVHAGHIQVGALCVHATRHRSARGFLRERNSWIASQIDNTV